MSLKKIVLIASALAAGWYLFIYEEDYLHVKELKLAAGQEITLDDLGGKNWVFFCYGIQPGRTSGTRVRLSARVFAKHRGLKYDDAYYPYEGSYSISAFLFVGPDGESNVYWIEFTDTEVHFKSLRPYRGNTRPPQGCHKRGQETFVFKHLPSGKIRITRI